MTVGYEQKYKLQIDQLPKERLKTSKLHWGSQWVGHICNGSGGSSKLRQCGGDCILME